MVREVCPDLRALRDPRENMDPLVRADQLDSKERRDVLASQGSLATPVAQDPRETRAGPEGEEDEDSVEKLDSLELKENKESQVLGAREARGANKASPDHSDPRATSESPDPLALLENKESKGLPDPPVLWDQLDPVELQVKMGRLDHQETVVSLVFLAAVVSLVQLV